MLSVTITVNKLLNDLYERNQQLQNLLKQYKIDYEFIYVCNNDYADLDTIKDIIYNNKFHCLITTPDDANIETQVYGGMTRANGNEVLLLTADTNLDLIDEILEKREMGYKNIYPKQSNNAINNFFKLIGISTYHFGQFILGRAYDMCNDPYIGLYGAETVNEIVYNPALSKFLRITNRANNMEYISMTRKNLHDHPTKIEAAPHKTLSMLGVVSLLYYVTLIFITCAMPFFNNGIYSWWMILAIVLWVLFGVFTSIIASKNLCNNRIKTSVPIDLNGNILVNDIKYYQYGDTLDDTNNTSKEIEKQTIKTKNKVTESKKSEPTKKRGRPKKLDKNKNTKIKEK